MNPSFRDRYAKEFLAGWGAMDFNGHLANGAMGLAADVEMAFFAEHGFPPGELRRLALGPVMRKDATRKGPCPFRSMLRSETSAFFMHPQGRTPWARG